MHPTFSLTIDPLDLRYRALIGTGGILKAEAIAEALGALVR